MSLAPTARRSKHRAGVRPSQGHEATRRRSFTAVRSLPDPLPADESVDDRHLATWLCALAGAAEDGGHLDRADRLRQAAHVVTAPVARTTVDTGEPPERRLRAVPDLPSEPAGLPARRPAAPGDGVGDGMTALTARQLEVADRVARGLTNRQIAGELGISERTAESHIKNILVKFGYAARTQIAALVGRHDLSAGLPTASEEWA